MNLLRNHYLNYIRAFTAISVLLTHLGTPTGFLHDFIDLYHKFIYLIFWSNGGLHFGVIFFVVMSGYLIHSTSKDIKIKDYYFKRLIRIYPLFFLTATIGFLTLKTSNYGDYILNLFLISSVFPISGPPGNEILITVVVEIVIYLLYPLYRNKKMNFVFIISTLIYFINIYYYTYFKTDPSFISRNLFTLLLYWNIGAYVSTIPKNILLNKSFKYLYILLCILYIIITNTFYFKGIHYFSSLFLAILFGLFLMFVLNFNIKIYYFKLLNLLGEAAYSIFALHYLIYRIFIIYFPLNSINYLILIFIIIIFSILSYFFIEQPINKLRYFVIDYLNKKNISKLTSK